MAKKEQKGRQGASEKGAEIFRKIVMENVTAIPDEDFRSGVAALIMAVGQMESVQTLPKDNNWGPNEMGLVFPKDEKLAEVMQANFTEAECVGFAALMRSSLIAVKTYNKLMGAMARKAERLARGEKP